MEGGGGGHVLANPCVLNVHDLGSRVIAQPSVLDRLLITFSSLEKSDISLLTKAKPEPHDTLREVNTCM